MPIRDPQKRREYNRISMERRRKKAQESVSGPDSPARTASPPAVPAANSTPEIASDEISLIEQVAAGDQGDQCINGPGLCFMKAKYGFPLGKREYCPWDFRECRFYLVGNRGKQIEMAESKKGDG